MTTASEFAEQWQRFRAFVRPGDVLRGRVWRRSATWWLVDLGAPFLANLDDIDTDPGVTEGAELEVLVKFHQDNKMMPFVTSRADDVSNHGRRRIELPDDLRGEIVWPVPT